MDEEMLNDLKQFITSTVSQATAGMVTKEDIADLTTKEDLQKLGTKLDDLELKVNTVSEALNENLSKHGTRLTELEQQAA
jgi:hypothetical protein